MHQMVSKQTIVLHVWKRGSVTAEEIPFSAIWTVSTFKEQASVV